MKEKMDECKCAFNWALDEYLEVSKGEGKSWREVSYMQSLAELTVYAHKVYCLCKEEALKEGVYDEDHHDHEDYEYYHKEKKHDGHMASPAGAHMSPKM